MSAPGHQDGPGGDPWLTPSQAAEQIGLHEATIRRAIKRAQLRAVRVGGGRSLRLRQSWLDAWMERFDAAPVRAAALVARSA